MIINYIHKLTRKTYYIKYFKNCSILMNFKEYLNEIHDDDKEYHKVNNKLSGKEQRKAIDDFENKIKDLIASLV